MSFLKHAGFETRSGSEIKGIVQRDVRWVESRLKRSALMNYIVAIVYFFKLKGLSCERNKKPVSAS